MKDPSSQLLTATRRAKSDVANKLIGMFLHELSRSLTNNYQLKVDSENYVERVREKFSNHCPYCRCSLEETASVVEHLEGMNRNRAGLHVPGNVLIACRKCNGEKRRDDSLATLTLAKSGWESFLSHTGDHCQANCGNCKYWASVWPDEKERRQQLAASIIAIQQFQEEFQYYCELRHSLGKVLPRLLAKLYSDCQNFAESEIHLLLSTIVTGDGKIV